MGITIKIISGTDGSGFQTELDTSIAAGERPIGESWSDGTNTYQKVEVYDSRERFYNPDLLSRSWRASNIIGASAGYPTSSRLSKFEYNVLYNPNALHSIGGTVTTASVGIQNITMSFGGDITTIFTDGSGIYSQNVPDGWDGTVIPTIGAAEFSPFTPVSRSYSDVQFEYSGQDYTQTNYVIEGTVESASIAIENVTMSFNGDSVVGVVYTDSSGDYTQFVAGGWVGTVTPEFGATVFSPVSRSYTNIGQHSASQDFDQA